jgi:hypothetical protein
MNRKILSGCNDFDWLEVNKLRKVYKCGGRPALVKAWGELKDKDPLQFALIACAYNPDHMPQRIKDAIEDAGYTLQELIELAKKRQH